MYLSGPHVAYPTVLVFPCYWVADFHKESFSFWTVEISCTAQHTVLLARQGLSSNIPLGFFYQVYYHQGGLDRNGTNLAQVWIDFDICIFCYHSRLSWRCRELSSSNRISNKKFMRWVWNLLFLALFFLFSNLIDLALKNTCCFIPYQIKRTKFATLSLTCAGLVLVNWCICQYNDHISYYVVNSMYMQNISPKLSENELSAHQPLRFTQGCGIDQIFIIWKCVYFIAKYNYTELLKALNYCEKLLPGISVVTLWIY